MNKQSHIAGAPLNSSPRSVPPVAPVSPLAGATVSLSSCPDCDGPLSHRIIDEDTGCSYPVDDGEHYCLSCDALWTDEYLAETGWALAERSALFMGGK